MCLRIYIRVPAAPALSNGHIRPPQLFNFRDACCRIFLNNYVRSYVWRWAPYRETRLALSQVTADLAIILRVQPALTPPPLRKLISAAALSNFRGDATCVLGVDGVLRYLLSAAIHRRAPDCLLHSAHSYVTPALYHTLRALLHPSRGKVYSVFAEILPREDVCDVMRDHAKINSKSQ